MTDAGYIRAPGWLRIGRMMSEKFVCKQCFDTVAADIGALFARGSTSDPTRCNMCLGHLIGGAMYAHYKPVTVDTWMRVPLCKPCFDTYEAVCKKNARRG